MLVRPKVLLLDVDGVVFSHRKTLKKVSSKVVEYVATQLNVDREEADSINNLLYTNFGHTQLGLNKVYKTSNTSKDFADFVYDAKMIDEIKAIDLYDDNLKASVDIQYVVKSCKNHDTDVFLFSNAPYAWCRAIVDTMGLKSIIEDKNILASDHDVFAGGLKPEKTVYDNVCNYLMHMYRDSSLQISFVDDSFTNLIPIIGDGRWRPIYFNKEGTRIQNKRILTVDSLYKIQHVI